MPTGVADSRLPEGEIEDRPCSTMGIDINRLWPVTNSAGTPKGK
jgi:hypothetical protein